MKKEDIHSYQKLDSENITKTVNILSKRIEERFPNSGLSKACKRLLDIARVAEARSEQIARPIYLLRAGVGIVILAMITIGVATIMNLKMAKSSIGLLEFIQTLEPGLNVLVLIGVAVFFLVSIEARIKRGRTLKAVHELRVIIHIIDMHQLTKDPEQMLGRGKDTASSPKRRMTSFELSRYLDYCSEMLALTGKIATLYIQNFNDSTAITSVNEVENLGNSISRKIWQKLVILNSRQNTEGTETQA